MCMCTRLARAFDGYVRTVLVVLGLGWALVMGFVKMTEMWAVEQNKIKSEWLWEQ